MNQRYWAGLPLKSGNIINVLSAKINKRINGVYIISIIQKLYKIHELVYSHDIQPAAIASSSRVRLQVRSAYKRRNVGHLCYYPSLVISTEVY